MSTETTGTFFRQKKTVAIIGLVLTVMFWGGNSVAGRLSVGDIPPIAFSFWRWLLAFLILLPFTWKRVLQKRTAIAQSWKEILALSILSISCFNTLLYLSVQSTQAVNVALLQVSLPIFTMIIAVPLLKQLPTRFQIIGMAIAAPGVLVILSKGQWQNIIGMNFGQGDLIMLTAVICWAFYTVLLKRFTLPVSGAPLLTICVGTGVFCLLPFYLWELSVKGGFEVTTGTSFLLAYVVIFASLVAYIFWNLGVQVLGASNAALFNFLIPVFSASFAIPLLGESLKQYHLWGALLIFAGLVITTRKTT